MKIIKFRNIATSPEIDIIPDSAIQKSGKPFFVPDFADKFRYRMATAVHVCRLGKNIAQKFANRYYEEAGLCLIFEASDLLDRLKADGMPTAIATAFDAAAITGEMVTVDAAQLGKSDAVLTINEAETERVATPSAADFDRCIEIASRYFTLKIGDLIIIETGELHDAIINDTVSATIANNQSIHIRIK